MLLLDIMELRTYARAKRVIEQPDSTEETLTQVGISQAMSSMVMRVIEDIGDQR